MWSTLLLTLTLTKFSALCLASSESGCADGVNCNVAELFCCPSSPGRLDVTLMPDWTQLFAKTLSLRPQLLHQLDTIDNSTERNCSLDVIDARREWMLDDMQQRCQRHRPIVCPEHSTTSTVSGPVTESSLTPDEFRLILIVAGALLLLVLSVVIIVVVWIICRRRQKMRQIHSEEHPSPMVAKQNGSAVKENGNTKDYNTQVSETNSRRQLITDECECDTPSPTPSCDRTDVLVILGLRDVTPAAPANHEPACADVNATSSSQSVIILCDPQLGATESTAL